MNNVRITAPASENTPQLNHAVAFASEQFKKANAFLPAMEIGLVLKDLGPDGVFRIETKGNTVIVTGSEEGLRCGLYTLMNALGFHWFSPNEPMILPGSEVRPDLSGLAGLHKPGFVYRGLHICGPGHFDDTVAQWMSFNRFNRKLTHMQELKQIGSRLNELGLRPDTTVHAYDLLIPDQKYFKSHPEFFAWVGGKRIPQGKGGQLCLSNLEMREVFARELLDRIKEHPEVGLYGFCPNDGYGHCECEKCRALDTPDDRKKNLVNGRVADFVADICARIAKVRPDVMLGHYSYSNFSDFLDLLKEPPENLTVSFTSFHCYSHSLFDPSCPTNQSHLARLEAIRKKVKHIYVYDYFSYMWHQLPAPYWDAMCGDFRNYRRLGLDGLMSECSSADNSAEWDTQWPNFYLAGRLFWNPELGRKDVFSEICRARYGKGAAAMENYYETLQQAVTDRKVCIDKKPQRFKEFFTPDVQKKCADALKNAAKAAPDNPFIAKEQKIFASQCENYSLRGKYQSPASVKAGKLTGDPLKLWLTDRSTQLPNLENDTKVWLSADGEKIHFRFQMNETRMKSLKTVKSVYGGDCIELFLDDGLNPQKCYHFIFDSDGQFIASECEGTRWNWSWKHNAEIRAEKTPDAWILNVTIPRKDIHAEKGFGFTVIRNRYAGGKWDITGTPDGGAFFTPSKYIRAE